jgi:hypothetical protein
MAEPVHVRELVAEVEPVGPAVEHVVAAVLAQIGVAALLVHLGARIGVALAEPLGNRARPPVEVGIDDVHLGFPAVTCVCLAEAPVIGQFYGSGRSR